MSNHYLSYLLNICIIAILVIIPAVNDAKEILIYADNISYDEEKNIIAKGNAKIYQNNQLIVSDLIIYEKTTKKIILPTTFSLKDKNNNFIQASNGYFTQDLEYGEFDNIKIKLSDGSRIIGNKGKRDGDIDIISKGVYTPCLSRIKLGNFICPTWQLEGEKILHDNKNLFLYQKHSKMRVINTPVFYLPYMVTPSPLRKDRKSGFLSPTIALNFFNTQTSQSTSFPYYFNLSEDKELTFTPTINYGGGVDSSQRFNFDYNQLISGGNISSELTFDSNFENENTDNWVSDGSFITNFSKNINENFRVTANSALETSQNYIQITKPDDDLSYKTSLTTGGKIEGFNLNRIDDYLSIDINLYQTNQKSDDDRTTPIVLPNIQYYSGNSFNYRTKLNYLVDYYNIFRNKETSIHSKRQQKISHKINTENTFYKFNSKINIKTETYNQIFETQNKFLQNEEFHSGTYYRFFPSIGFYTETPFRLKKDFNSFIFEPNTSLIITPGFSNTNKISNEDSSNNNLTINNINQLNRYTGSDKMDNSKRINYGINVYDDRFNFEVSQSYEFTDNSNFHKEQGNNNNLSDLFGSVRYSNINTFDYNFRYDSNERFLKEQNVQVSNLNKFGTVNLSYLDQKSKNDNIIVNDTETLNYGFKTNKFLRFSEVELSGLYDLKKEINTEYKIKYSYFDECFGINLDFSRKSYKEDNLEPQDLLTLMFSFKNIGSYKSTNLAVSEKDKQDIEWEGINLEDVFVPIVE